MSLEHSGSYSLAVIASLTYALSNFSVDLRIANKSAYSIHHSSQSSQQIRLISLHVLGSNEQET